MFRADARVIVVSPDNSVTKSLVSVLTAQIMEFVNKEHVSALLAIQVQTVLRLYPRFQASAPSMASSTSKQGHVFAQRAGVVQTAQQMRTALTRFAPSA